jgi:DNA mismatch repair protein MLH1
VAAKYALHYGGRGVGFVCRKVRDASSGRRSLGADFCLHRQASSNVADLSTPASPSTKTIDAIRALHGSAVSRELLHLTPLRNERLGFSVEGYISGANWSAKKTTFLCFINGELTLRDTTAVC